MSQKLLDDLKNEVELHAPKVADRITAFVLVVADRVANLGGDAVKASDLASTLRLDPESLGALVATNPPEPALAVAVDPVKPATAGQIGGSGGGNGGSAAAPATDTKA